MTRRLVAIAVASLAACAPPGGRGTGAASDSAAAASATSSRADTATTARPEVRAEAVAPDSVRGVIESVGSEPLTHLIVRQHDRSICAVSAAPGVVTAAVAGLEVTLWGARTTGAPPTMPGVTCAIAASRFAVRAADGIPAVDGVLRADGASFALELATGERRALRNVPAVLRTRIGARIFWAGPLDRAPTAYGVLRVAP